MKSELERRLHMASKEQLVSLVQELTIRHPTLLAETLELSGQFSSTSSNDSLEEDETEIDSEATENWDFSGDDDDLIELHSVARPSLPPLNFENKRQLVDDYVKRLQQGETRQSVGSDLLHLLREAEVRAEQHDYQGALNLYALVLDKRLAEKSAMIISVFDKAIDESIPFLEALLSETSSSIAIDSSLPLVPLLTPPMRQDWLGRLFALWLRRLDFHQTEEDIPAIMLDVAWHDDAPLLRTFVQNELLQLNGNNSSNIVDFARQYRMRALEKFLKEVSYL